MSKQAKIEDIPSGIIDVGRETDRFEQWYCWVHNFDLVEWRKKQAELAANNRSDSVVHHCRCTWLNAKRDMVNQRKVIMAAHDKLVRLCEHLGDESYETKDVMAALATVKEASDGKAD